MGGTELVDIAKGEMIEHELTAMIERRSRHKDPEEASELWKESVRRYNAHRQEEMRTAWYEYHQDQAARHKTILESLIARHEVAAARLQRSSETLRQGPTTGRGRGVGC
jgi:hypothetical protein